MFQLQGKRTQDLLSDEVATVIKPWGPAIQKRWFPKFIRPQTVILRFRQDRPASYHEIREGIFRAAPNSLVFLGLALATDLTTHCSLSALTSSPSLNFLLMNAGQKLCNVMAANWGHFFPAKSHHSLSQGVINTCKPSNMYKLEAPATGACISFFYLVPVDVKGHKFNFFKSKREMLNC